jgi:hypothetical protein
MPSNPASQDHSIFPEEPLSLDDATSSRQKTEMLDVRPRTSEMAEAALSRGDELLEKIAAELYRIGSMLLGEGEEAIGLVERVVTSVALPVNGDRAQSRHNARLLLAADAIAILGQRDAADHSVSLAAPADDSGPASCIEDDDLSAAGVTTDELEHMISGPERHRLRDWLEGLSVSLRVIFVLRAVAGLSSAEVAGILAERGGPAAQDWTPDAVRGSFRQALCSLASLLIHATATR